MWINAKEKSLPQPPSEPAAGLSHEDGKRQKASFMTAEYAKLTKQGKKKVRDEFGAAVGGGGSGGSARAGTAGCGATAGSGRDRSGCFS